MAIIDAKTSKDVIDVLKRAKETVIVVETRTIYAFSPATYGHGSWKHFFNLFKKTPRNFEYYKVGHPTVKTVILKHVFEKGKPIPSYVLRSRNLLSKLRYWKERAHKRSSRQRDYL